MGPLWVCRKNFPKLKSAMAWACIGDLCSRCCVSCPVSLFISPWFYPIVLSFQQIFVILLLALSVYLRALQLVSFLVIPVTLKLQFTRLSLPGSIEGRLCGLNSRGKVAPSLSILALAVIWPHHWLIQWANSAKNLRTKKRPGEHKENPQLVHQPLTSARAGARGWVGPFA